MKKSGDGFISSHYHGKQVFVLYFRANIGNHIFLNILLPFLHAPDQIFKLILSIEKIIFFGILALKIHCFFLCLRNTIV